MADDAPEGGKKKLSLGQAIDAVTEALGSFESGEQQIILRAVYDQLKISGPTTSGVMGSSQTRAVAETASADQTRASAAVKRPDVGEYAGMDIRTFKELKQPNSARQMACVVAFYLSEVVEDDEKKDTITAADLDKYFKQAKFPVPKALEQVLPDAKSGGYFEGSARGEYKLNRVGYNLVAHSLPPKAKG